MSLSPVRYQRLRGLAGELAQVAVECFAGNCRKSDDLDTGRESACRTPDRLESGQLPGTRTVPLFGRHHSAERGEFAQQRAEEAAMVISAM
jgi:hypothetical protein